jgi:hypothetical protein
MSFDDSCIEDPAANDSRLAAFQNSQHNLRSSFMRAFDAQVTMTELAQNDPPVI